MFRLKGWKYDPASSRRPIQMAQMTVDLVFDRIGPGITTELRERRTEIRETTGRSGYLHQVMTPDVGHPALQHHLSGISFLAKAFPDGAYEAFHQAMDRVAPRNNRTLPLPFPDSSIPDANGLGPPSSR
ncbi:P63C domain-containing protein [Candidatus Binatus sp.]|uniref:P63C domain-containing protein n=1 Tax=Candidatus Binatus sp. TaxID=2811406 RepID=UPI00351D6285